MAISSGSFAKQGGWGQPVTIAACLPYEVTNFPWLTYMTYPSDGTRGANYYNTASEDGVSLNLNLGGYANSWTSTGVPDDPNGVYVTLVNKTAATILADGPEVYDDGLGNVFVDLWRYSSSYTVNDPTVLARYAAVGGTTDGVTLPAPGLTTYPGVASSTAWQTSSRYIQARNFGQPIIFELWYSLNPSRTTPLSGFGSYTFYGDQPNQSPPYVQLSQPNAFIKKYQFGILRATADMNNLTDSDFIAGMSFVGNDTAGVAKLIVNGVVVSTTNTTQRVVSITGGAFDTIAEGNSTDFGSAKSNVNEMQLPLTFADTSTQILTFGPTTLPATAGKIDTYLTKWAWIVDTDLAGAASDNPIWAYPPMMYTVPAITLSCAPTSPVPNYTPPPPIL